MHDHCNYTIKLSFRFQIPIANKSDNTAMYFTEQNKVMAENLFSATATRTSCIFPFIFQKGEKSYPSKACLCLQQKGIMKVLLKRKSTYP